MNDQPVISKMPLTQEAYNIIKKMIIDLEFRPGEILLVQQLANKLEFSRTPVREALVKLSQDGLVEEADGRKFKVAEVNIRTIKEIYELREALECLSISKVIHQINNEDIAVLENLISEMEKALADNDYNTFFNADMEFHFYIVHKYGNSLLESVMRQITDHQQRIRYLTTYIDKRMANTIEEHKEIVASLTNHNEETTIKAMLLHLHNVEAGFIHLMQNGNVKYYGIPM